MLRWLMKILVIVAVLWAGWWWIATSGLQKGLEAFWQSQRNDGLETTVQETARSGFPFKIGANLRGISISDPAAQTQLDLPQIKVTSPIYWPGHARVALSSDPITFTAPQGPLTLTSDGMQADMRLHPGAALELEALRGVGSGISLDAVEGRVISIEDVKADVTQGAAPETYAITFTATGFAPGSLLRQGMQIPDAWAQSFAPVIADMTVTFDRPWDRSALRDTRPQPRNIVINQVTAEWEQLGMGLSGQLNVDAAGVPTGAVRVQVRNWQRIFDMAIANTNVPQQWASTIEGVLGAMSDAEGTLDLPITLENGQMRVGFLPLGPAPRLILR